MADTMRELSVYQVFCEPISLVSDSGIDPSGCASCSCTPLLEDGIFFRKGRPTRHHRTESFRAATASLRYHTLTIPRTIMSDSFEKKYIIPVMCFAEKYMFQASQLSYELNTSPAFTEVTFWTSNDKWQTKKVLVCLLVVKRGAVCWLDFLFPDEGGKVCKFCCTKNLQIIRKIHELCNIYSPQRLVLTDELQACIVRELSPYPGESAIIYDRLNLGNISLRCILGGLLNEVAPEGDRFNPRMEGEILRGALNETKAGMPIAINPEPSGFSDFDLFTMRRHLPDARWFLDWKARSMQEALSHPLVVGDLLQVDVDAFIEREPIFSSSLPLQKPPEVSLHLIMTRPRSRRVEIDRFLNGCGTNSRDSEGSLFFQIFLVCSVILTFGRNLVRHVPFIRFLLSLVRLVPFIGSLHSSTPSHSTRRTRHAHTLLLSFRIDQIVRAKPNTFSQVFFGRLCRGGNTNSSSTCETRICLKFFDEVFFPVFDPSELDEYKELECNPYLNLHAASDMMRREHAVYQHLQYLQGTLLPHVYGFHQFILPDGRKIWGFFSEIIEGTKLCDLQLDQLTENLKNDLVRRLRHGVRTLLYGGVLQDDWDLGHIFVNWVTDPDGNAEPALVFVDFAFSRLRSGLGNIAWHFRRTDPLWMELYDMPELCSAVRRDDIWLPWDDFEW
ncbi:hypothetical protein E1B28_008349 [Marasmius oreades]|uniref:Uncharacterized protein n=1 Tax=Marasmius oreades TaxID=181124 RepID=A0A9P7RYV7_9AGAR|nr:uncharacterized protein E1B28_008349 [Marasmius oreades]KAG7091960.1 hypothetical protein E1B28_008349 [Marasmius oreades]